MMPWTPLNECHPPKPADSPMPHAHTEYQLWPVSPSGEMACFSEIPADPTGHRSGHGMRQIFCKFDTSRLLSILKMDNKPDIHADI